MTDWFVHEKSWEFLSLFLSPASSDIRHTSTDEGKHICNTYCHETSWRRSHSNWMSACISKSLTFTVTSTNSSRSLSPWQLWFNVSVYEADDRSMANHQTWHKKISFPSKEWHHLERATDYDGTKDCIETNTFWSNHSSIRNESNLWQVWHTLIPSIEIKLKKEALSFCVSELCLVSTMKASQNVHSLRFEKSCSKEFSSADWLDASWRSLSQIIALTNFFAAHSARCY